MTKPVISLTQARAAVVELVQDGDSPRVRAALSSETPVNRGPFMEVLKHTAEAIDLSRAAGSGLPLTVGHSEMDFTSQDLPIGRVRNVALEGDGKLRGDIEFDTDERSVMVRDKMLRGFAPDLSVTYQILDHDKPTRDGTVNVTRWAPQALSVVSVPADPAAGVGRSAPEVEKMSEESKVPEAPASEDIITQIKARAGVGVTTGARQENERLTAITDMARSLSASIPGVAFEIEELARHARGDLSMSADSFRSAAFDLISGSPEPLSLEPPVSDARAPSRPGAQRQPLVTPGSDSKERAARGMVLSLLERVGSTVKPEEMEGNQYRGWTMLDMARDCLELHGHNTRGWSTEQIARAAIAMPQARAISPGTANYITSDFPAVTENVITKRVHDGFAAAPVTWDRWCSTTTVPDFKQFTIPRLSQISDLPIVAENIAYTDLTQTDAKEAATLVKRGGLMSFSWEAIVNDDQRMFSRTSASMGEAANRTIDKNVYALLVLNQGVGVGGPVMGDTNQLFDTTNHANYGTDALALDGIVATRTRMARQTDDNAIELGIELRYVIVPEELRDAADNLAGSEYLPWTEASPGAQRVNTIRSSFTVVPTIRLTDTNDWFAAAANGSTIEVAFLTGNNMPSVMRDMGWDTDALHFKIRHPSIAYPVDWRGLQWNEVT